MYFCNFSEREEGGNVRLLSLDSLECRSAPFDVTSVVLVGITAVTNRLNFSVA